MASYGTEQLDCEPAADEIWQIHLHRHMLFWRSRLLDCRSTEGGYTAGQVGDDEIYLVVNAGCREKDLAHIKKHLDKFTVSSLACP